MAEECGFFTSVGGDRKYNAAFLNRKLHEATQCEDGILTTEGRLAVTKTGSLSLSVAAGSAIMGGMYYRNSAALSLTLGGLGAGLKRRDRILVHIDRYVRTMKVTVLKGTEAATPTAPVFSVDDDIPLAQALVELSGGQTVVTITDERQMRPVFLTDRDTIDALSEGQVYGRVLKAKADALNTGQVDVSFRKFIFTAKGWTDSRGIYAFAMLSERDDHAARQHGDGQTMA